MQNYGEKNTILAVVGNKFDLFEKEQVTEEEAREFAEKRGAIFMSTSCENGGDNIKELFESLAKKYLSLKYNSKLNEMKNERTQSFRLGIDKNDKYYKKKCC